MNAQAYYRHIRSMGAFRAIEAIALAREAAELDKAASARRAAAPGLVAREVLPDGSVPVSLTFAIKVF